MTLLEDAIGVAGIPSTLLGHLFSIVLEALPADCQHCSFII